MELLSHRRSYARAEKVRCVAHATVFPQVVKEDVRERYFARAGIAQPTFERYWRERIRGRADAEVGPAIRQNIRYLFDRASPPFPTGRFNTASFAMLYTAKNAATAKAERFHHVADATVPFDYVVYSMFVTAEVADLRPLSQSGTLVLDDSYSLCNQIAEELRGKVGGIAWRSVRHLEGSCCAFFSCEDAAPGSIIEQGSVTTGQDC